MIEQIDLMSYVLPTFKFPKDYKIKIFEAFSGIGCQRLALKRLTDNYESVGISEIDKPALKSYEAIHGDCKNYGSICDIHELPKIDIFTWSFPCTDLSKAGKQKGLGSKEKGQEQTRSGLCYEVLRVLHENTNNLPRVLIMENVIDLIQVKFISQFNEIQREIESLGYKNYTFVMNGKNYGIPQNRERVFMVSILSDYQEYYYEQPKPFKLEKRLKDLLEDSVDEKYYLSKKMIDYCTGFNRDEEKNKTFDRGKMWYRNLKRTNEIGIASTVTTAAGNRASDNFLIEDEGGVIIPNATKKGYLIAQEGDGVDVSGRVKYHRGTVQKGIAQTLKTGNDVGVCVVGNYSPSGHNASRIVDDNGLAPCVKENHGTVTAIAENLKTQLCNKLVEENIVKEGDIVKHSYTNKILNGEKKAVEKQGEMITLTTRPDCVGVCVDDRDKGFGIKTSDICFTQRAERYGLKTVDKNLRIRKLTPKECWRLMGIDDEDFDKAAAVNSNAQLYKQAGNGIIVDVFYYILRGLMDESGIKPLQERTI